MCTTTALTFLTATDQQRRERGTPTGHQHPDPFRSAELVRGERHQVDVRCDLTKVQPARRLHGVGVHNGIGRNTINDCGNCGEVGDRADLVVDGHHADYGNVIQGISKRVEIEAAGGVDTDDLPVTGLHGVQYGVMLDRGTQRNAAAALQRPEDRRVVRLGTTAGEDHLAGTASEDIGDVVARFVDRLAHLPGEPV